jgi:hypothetical protein
MARRLKSSLRDYVEVLNDDNVAQFLASKNWSIQRSHPYEQVWLQPGRRGKESAVVQLPRDRGLVDYSRRMLEVLETLCETFKWTPGEVVEQVSLVRADLFFVRVDQFMADGTIPLRQASALLENIDSLLRASAVAAYDPYSSGRGRLPNAVNAFLNEDLRMGHTKRGSFIITVAARIEDEHFIQEDSSVDRKPSFTRQVMTTLGHSLVATKKQLVTSEGQRPSIDEALAEGVRLPIALAIEEMGDAEGLRALDMSFEWAKVDSGAVDLPTERVVLTREELDEIPTLREKLTRREEPQNETLVGPVIELRRSEASKDGREDTEVVLRADVNGRLVRVAVPLAGRDYDLAIRAHQSKLPFTVSGVLGRRGNSWRLLDDIEVDREFLDHHFRSQH